MRKKKCLWYLGIEGDVASPKKKKRRKHQDTQHLPNGAVHHQAAPAYPDTGRQSSGRIDTAPASAQHAQPSSNSIQAEAAAADESLAGQYVCKQIQVELVTWSQEA